MLADSLVESSWLPSCTLKTRCLLPTIIGGMDFIWLLFVRSLFLFFCLFSFLFSFSSLYALTSRVSFLLFLVSWFVVVVVLFCSIGGSFSFLFFSSSSGRGFLALFPRPLALSWVHVSLFASIISQSFFSPLYFFSLSLSLTHSLLLRFILFHFLSSPLLYLFSVLFFVSRVFYLEFGASAHRCSFSPRVGLPAIVCARDHEHPFYLHRYYLSLSLLYIYLLVFYLSCGLGCCNRNSCLFVFHHVLCTSLTVPAYLTSGYFMCVYVPLFLCINFLLLLPLFFGCSCAQILFIVTFNLYPSRSPHCVHCFVFLFNVSIYLASLFTFFFSLHLVCASWSLLLLSFLCGSLF